MAVVPRRERVTHRAGAWPCKGRAGTVDNAFLCSQGADPERNITCELA